MTILLWLQGWHPIYNKYTITDIKDLRTTTTEPEEPTPFKPTLRNASVKKALCTEVVKLQYYYMKINTTFCLRNKFSITCIVWECITNFWCFKWTIFYGGKNYKMREKVLSYGTDVTAVPFELFKGAWKYAWLYYFVA